MKKKPFKVVIVILNYMNYQETISCVNSALLQKGTEFKIVVVDNGSTNESYKIIMERYCNNRQVRVLKSKENLGFAKGNNLGIKFAKEKLKADFILLLNSDTIVTDEYYISKMISNYDESVGVIGSEIRLRNKKVQKPYCEYVEFPATLLYYLKIFNELYGWNIFGNQIDKLLKKYKKKIILHGSAFMLTPSYLKQYNGLYNKTFLYGEEILLYLLCKRANLKQVYVSDTNIWHKEDQSSKYLFKNKNAIKMKYLFQSYKYVVIESFKNYINNK